MTAADRSELERRAWRAVQVTFKAGDRCDGCEHCIESGPASDEPYSRDCRVLDDEDPRLCPGCDIEAIRDEMDADREEYEESRREMFSARSILGSLGYRHA